MIRHIKRYFAIRSYLRRLSGDLLRRFGRRATYTVKHVTQAIQRGKFSTAFIAYAHAIFCSREDFDAHFGPLGVACTYDGLRKPIAKRYFSGRMDFDAGTVIGRFGSAGYSRGDYSESGIGSNYSGH